MKPLVNKLNHAHWLRMVPKLLFLPKCLNLGKKSSLMHHSSFSTIIPDRVLQTHIHYGHASALLQTFKIRHTPLCLHVHKTRSGIIVKISKDKQKIRYVSSSMHALHFDYQIWANFFWWCVYSQIIKVQKNMLQNDFLTWTCWRHQ